MVSGSVSVSVYIISLTMSMLVIKMAEGACNLWCPVNQQCAWKNSVCRYGNCPRYQVCVSVDATIKSDFDVSTNDIPYSLSAINEYCPGQTSNGPCIEQCRSNGDCRANEFCCFNGCGHTCKRKRPRNIQKPGSCPWHTRFSRRTCNRECFSDMDCNGLDKCCETGCGSACTEPCFYWLRTFPTSTTAWKLPQRCSRQLYF